jgi:hypothetical protein
MRCDANVFGFLRWSKLSFDEDAFGMGYIGIGIDYRDWPNEVDNSQGRTLEKRPNRAWRMSIKSWASFSMAILEYA